MADQSTIDPKTGFCSKTKIFHSLRPEAPLPLLSAAISVTEHAFSLLDSFPTPPTAPALLDAVNRRRISFHEFILLTKNLSSSLHHRLGLKKGDTAFILCPNSVDIPIICFSLLSIGIIISPANPFNSKHEILHQIQLSKPVIAFSTADFSNKLPENLKLVLINSPEFESFMNSPPKELVEVKVYQSDPAAILYSSGTTGRVKGVMLTHRNLTYGMAVGQAIRVERKTRAVCFCAVPFFHVYGLSYSMRTVAMGETVVVMSRFDMKIMLRAIEEFRITHMALAPPVIAAIVKNLSLMDGYDLSSLEVVGCGGDPLTKSIVQQFMELFPNVILGQA